MTVGPKEGWSLKNWRFQTVVLEKTLESPLESNEIKPVNSKGNQPWSWSSNTVATWYEELNHWKRPWCSERLRARWEVGSRGWDVWMAHHLKGHEFEQTSGDVTDREAWYAAVHGVTKSQTRLSNWTTITHFPRTHLHLKSGNSITPVPISKDCCEGRC